MSEKPHRAFNLSFWPHALVQMIAFLLLFLGRNEIAFLNEIWQKVGKLFEAEFVFASLLVWILFSFLLSEVLIIQSQKLAVVLFSNQRIGFGILVFALVSASMYFLSIALICMLFLAITGQYPLDNKAMWFSEGYIITIKAAWNLWLVFGLGEILRQLIYRKSIDNWRRQYFLRKKPIFMQENEEEAQ